jgi:hypothetical protein
MATWIAHLRIAENLLERIPELDPGQFAIGNIAPDSGIPDEKWEKFTPPPEVTHFKRSKSVHKDIADLDFYRDYLVEVSPEDTNRFSFRLGYFFHLITDNLWTIEIGRPTSERWAEQFAADKKFIWEVKMDWYGLDQIYVREHPDCLFWRVFLDAEPYDAAPPEGGRQDKPASAELNFLPLKALPRQMKHIKSFYQREDDEIETMMARPMIYLSKDEMDRFVSNATERIYDIYQMLWPIPPTLDGKFSALELAES